MNCTSATALAQETKAAGTSVVGLVTPFGDPLTVGTSVVVSGVTSEGVVDVVSGVVDDGGSEDIAPVVVD